MECLSDVVMHIIIITCLNVWLTDGVHATNGKGEKIRYTESGDLSEKSLELDEAGQKRSALLSRRAVLLAH